MKSIEVPNGVSWLMREPGQMSPEILPCNCKGQFEAHTYDERGERVLEIICLTCHMTKKLVSNSLTKDIGMGE